MTYYIIESSGQHRQMWGPYESLTTAKKAAGKRHSVICGTGLRSGEKMTSGALNAALTSGRIYPVDGTDKYALT